MGRINHKIGWTIVLLLLGLFTAYGVSLVVADTPWWRFVLRLYQDKGFLKTTVESWGYMGPIVFIVIQALQVIISPIPGEATGLVGGFLFGVGLGFLYSTIGLTLGTLACFGIGRWLGASFVQRFVAEHHWERMGFIVEAEGAILCFVLYLIPGFPKDIISYLFGLSPMPFWVFTVVATLGRVPGTWILSTQGSQVAPGQLRELALLLAATAAIIIPLYYYRHRIVRVFRREGPGARRRKGLTRGQTGS
ncbi:MAG: TVP38/TMEM64 family protein [Candidatus Rokubacteria bacterium]|nr:TVP38/TMEM64 family protein [Candidatus Rokubacteria bacterium]